MIGELAEIPPSAFSTKSNNPRLMQHKLCNNKTHWNTSPCTLIWHVIKVSSLWSRRVFLYICCTTETAQCVLFGESFYFNAPVKGTLNI